MKTITFAMIQNRKFEVVLIGATGFTGKLVAEYFLKEYGVGKSLRWAIAARSSSKLNAVLLEISKYVQDSNEAFSIPTIVADSHDEDSLNSLCAQTDCVLSTVGPFAIHGTLLVKCCIKNKTAYCDSTGETFWIRKMLDKFQDDAVNNKVRIVPSCAYDSLPSDIGVLTMVNGMRKDGETSIGEINHYVGPAVGGASGGTVHTLLHMISGENRKLVLDVLSDPYALVPGEKGVDTVEQRWMHWVDELQLYTAPFVMSGANERIVRRSASLLSYGKSFRFHESVALSNPFKAFLISLATMMTVLLALPPVQWLVKKILPKPGEGPSRRVQEKGYAYSTMISTNSDLSKYYVVEIGITKGDAGYRSTAFMLAESAIALARTKNLDGKYGFLTPASCPGLQMSVAKNLEEKCGIWFRFSKYNDLKTARRLVRKFDSSL